MYNLKSEISVNAESVDGFFENVYEYVKTHIVGILNALLVFAIGYVVIKLLCSLLTRALKKSKSLGAAQSIIVTLTKIALYTLLILIASSSLGIDVTGAVALVSVIGLAVSLSVQDALKNFTGGLQIVVTKPFNIGDYVEIGSKAGTVREIGMVYTSLVTVDNKHIYIPNSQMSTATITNFSAENKRRLDLVFSISYEDDFNKAKAIIERIIQDNLYVLHNEEHLVRVTALSNSSVDIAVRVWAHKDNYWNLNFDMQEQVKEEFDKAGITIPYNQLVITNKADEKK